MKPISKSLAAALLVASASSLYAGEPLLVADAPIKVPDSTGGFDFLKIDATHNRLLANHTGNNTLDVFDLADGKLLKHIATGKAQDVAVDEEAGTYLVGVSKERKVIVVDADKLAAIREIKLDGPADAIVFNPKKHELYVGHDDGKDLWVVSPRENKVVATIAIAEAPEVVIYDAASDRVFQNIKSDATVLAIDAETHQIKETWSTAPATGPHGLAFNPVTNHLFCAGANGKLSVVDAKTGKNAGSVNIAKGVDQIAFDPANSEFTAPADREKSVSHRTHHRERPHSVRLIARTAQKPSLTMRKATPCGSPTRTPVAATSSGST